ncbi:MAG TPA: hypothetical protein VFK20_08960 [Vicinamibacterales bacterium]|nr:hypothetical protein [Vicinamibacterales bacterium]
MKLGIREGAISMTVFAAILLALTTLDPRVQDRVSELIGGSGGVSPLGDRLADVGSALWSAARYQSIENAPMLVFAAIGAVLTLFMFRS